MTKTVVRRDEARKAIGPYSQAIQAWLYGPTRASSLYTTVLVMGPLYHFLLNAAAKGLLNGVGGRGRQLRFLGGGAPSRRA